MTVAKEAERSSEAATEAAGRVSEPFERVSEAAVRASEIDDKAERAQKGTISCRTQEEGASRFLITIF